MSAVISYFDKLRDGRWQRKRLEVLERDGFKCVKCGSSDDLQVHHNWYLKGYEPWDYRVEQLVTLCGIHHAEITKIQDEIKAILSFSGPDKQKIFLDFLRKHDRPGSIESFANQRLEVEIVLASRESDDLRIDFKITKGEHEGRMFTRSLSIWSNSTDSRDDKSELTSLCRAINILRPKDIGEFLNKRCMAFYESKCCKVVVFDSI